MRDQSTDSLDTKTIALAEIARLAGELAAARAQGTPCTPEQTQRVARVAADVYRAAADRIEAVARGVADPDDAHRQLHLAIAGDPISSLLELAQDELS